MIFLYVLPLIVIIVTYGGIVIHLHRVGAGNVSNLPREVLDYLTNSDDNCLSMQFQSTVPEADEGVVNGIQLAAVPSTINGELPKFIF